MHPLQQQNRQLTVQDLGTLPYDTAWAHQRAVVDSIVAIKVANRTRPPEAQQPTFNQLLFCSHPPVYTLGKSGAPANLLKTEAELAAEGVAFVRTDRGGDITFHGPGQLIGYPILDLENFFTDLSRYLRTLEETIILTCAQYNLPTARIKGLTGVWVGADTPFPRKIAALGVKCTRWVTLHGFAFNLTTDLRYFQGIVPCGIDPNQKGVTSLYQETGLTPDHQTVLRQITTHLLTLLDATEVPATEATAKNQTTTAVGAAPAGPTV